MQSKGTQVLKRKRTVHWKSQKEQKSSKAKQPLQQLKSISTAMMSTHPKFEKGKWMLNVNDLCKAGRFCVELHNYYILNWKKVDVIVVKYRNIHFLRMMMSLSFHYPICMTGSTSTRWMYLSCAASHCKSTKTSLFNTLNIRFTCA
jgi:hypothetical protein